MKKTLNQILMDEARQTELHEWMKTVQVAVRQTDIKNPATWTALEKLSKNISAMSWLVKQLRKHCPYPLVDVEQQMALYILTAYCPDNDALGYVMDTYQNYLKSRNREGLRFCMRMQAAINDTGKHPNLNYLYNQITGDMIRQFQSLLVAREQEDTTFLTEEDFRMAEKYLPDFKCNSFKNIVELKAKEVRTGSELAKCCHISETTFRERFQQTFGMNVAEWLREKRKKNIEEMLKHADMLLTKVAEANDFNSLSTFSDYCKRNFGKSPSEIRKDADNT